MTNHEANAVASLHELPDTSQHPEEMRLMLKSKHTPMHIHFLGTESLLIAPENKLQILFKNYAKSNQTFLSQKSQISLFPPSSTLMSIFTFTAPLHSSSPGHGPFPRTRGYPFSTLTLVPRHFTSDHPSLHSRTVTHNHRRPQSLIITQKCPPFPQDSRSPLFNYRSRYFPSLHLNSC